MWTKFSAWRTAKRREGGAAHGEKKAEARRAGVASAERVAARYASSDALVIARRAGLSVEESWWPLVTAGECDRRRAVIAVNEAALARAKGDGWFSARSLRRAIVAHELGHFFDPERAKSSEAEIFAHAFAETLLRLPFKIEEYENLWRERRR